jgi:two-component system chemotaxis response regulator CheY
VLPVADLRRLVGLSPADTPSDGEVGDDAWWVVPTTAPGRGVRRAPRAPGGSLRAGRRGDLGPAAAAALAGLPTRGVVRLDGDTTATGADALAPAAALLDVAGLLDLVLDPRPTEADREPHRPDLRRRAVHAHAGGRHPPAGRVRRRRRGHDGAEAVERYRALRPDFVTMDIVMPDMGGIDALRAIRAEHPEARVLMCSAMGQQALVVEAIQAGARDFVVKPFQPGRVLEAVERVLAA